MEHINKIIMETIREGAREASKMKLQEALDSDFFERQRKKLTELYQLKRVQEIFQRNHYQGIDAFLQASRELMLEERAEKKEKKRREKELRFMRDEDEKEMRRVKRQTAEDEKRGGNSWELYLKQLEREEKIEEERKLRDAEETKKREEDFERRLKDLELKEKRRKEDEKCENEQKAKEAIERKAKKDAEKAEKHKQFQRRK